jgi:hypothetical protein
MTNHFSNINFMTSESKSQINMSKTNLDVKNDDSHITSNNLQLLKKNSLSDDISLLKSIDTSKFPFRGYICNNKFRIIDLTNIKDINDDRKISRGKDSICHSRDSLLNILNKLNIIPKSSQKTEIIKQIEEAFIERDYIISLCSLSSSSSIPIQTIKREPKVFFVGDVPTKDNIQFCGYYHKNTNELCFINVCKKDFVIGKYNHRKFQYGKSILKLNNSKIIKILNVLNVHVNANDEHIQKEELYLLLEKAFLDWEILC